MGSSSKPREHCLSPLVFYQILAGERDGLEKEYAHLEECDSCRAHLEKLQAAREETLTPDAIETGVDGILSAYENEQKKTEVVRLSNYRIAAWAGIALAAAASIALVLWINTPSRVESFADDGQTTPLDGGIRLKGGTVFQVLSVHQGKGRILREQDTVRTGDVLAFKVLVNRPRYVSIAAIGEQVDQDAYFLDPEQNAPWKAMPGSAEQLPVSAVLDEQPDDERLFALFCGSPSLPFAALDTIEQLYRAEHGSRRNLEPERNPSLDGCEVKSVLLRRN